MIKYRRQFRVMGKLASSCLTPERVSVSICLPLLIPHMVLKLKKKFLYLMAAIALLTSRVEASAPRWDGATVTSWFVNNCSSCFQPGVLSSEQTRIRLRVKVLDERPSIAVSSTEHATAADIFYCKQSIWEGAPYELAALKVPPEGYKLTNEFDVDFAANQTSKNRYGSDLLLHKSEKNFVSIHLIPEPLMVRTIYLNRGDQSYQTLLKIPVELADSELLDKFRAEWFAFQKGKGRDERKISKEEVMAEAQLLKDKYCPKMFEEWQ